MDVIDNALLYEKGKFAFNSRDERIKASRKLKNLILDLNELYKKENDPYIMDLMKKLTKIKRRVESRLKGRLTV
jgi:hypothetical protein